jgi:hypothetical protein
MNTIDDLLERAGLDTREHLAHAPSVPVSTVRRRARRRTGANAVAGVLGAGGALVSVWLVSTRDGDQAPASPPAAATTVPDDNSTSVRVRLETVPLLGISLPDWAVVEAGETDEPNGAPSRWLAYANTGAGGQLRAGANLNLFVIPVGSPEEQSIMPPALELERLDVAGRDVGHYTNQLLNGFTFAWRESDTVMATLTVFGVDGGAGEPVTKSEALAVIEGIRPLTAEQWANTMEAVPETGATVDAYRITD